MSQDRAQECPLCLEELDVTDRNFKPCKCGYQVCLWCWHNIKENLQGKCPACRQPYVDDNIEFVAPAPEQIQRQLSQKKDKKTRVKPPGTPRNTQDRAALANVRVLQRNLLYVVGIPPSIAREDILRRKEYFGRFGRIVKVAVNRKTMHASDPRPSCSAYVTFKRTKDAGEAIKAVQGTVIEGRTLRCTFGTSNYCSHFLRHSTCTNPSCLYLHDFAKPGDCFTKEALQALQATERFTIAAPSPTHRPQDTGKTHPRTPLSRGSSAPTTPQHSGAGDQTMQGFALDGGFEGKVKFGQGSKTGPGKLSNPDADAGRGRLAPRSLSRSLTEGDQEASTTPQTAPLLPPGGLQFGHSFGSAQPIGSPSILAHLSASRHASNGADDLPSIPTFPHTLTAAPVPALGRRPRQTDSQPSDVLFPLGNDVIPAHLGSLEPHHDVSSNHCQHSSTISFALPGYDVLLSVNSTSHLQPADQPAFAPPGLTSTVAPRTVHTEPVNGSRSSQPSAHSRYKFAGSEHEPAALPAMPITTPFPLPPPSAGLDWQHGFASAFGEIDLGTIGGSDGRFLNSLRRRGAGRPRLRMFAELASSSNETSPALAATPSQDVRNFQLSGESNSTKRRASSQGHNSRSRPPNGTHTHVANS